MYGAEMYDRNEDAEIDVWCYKMDRIRNEIFRGTRKVGEIANKVQERRL